MKLKSFTRETFLLTIAFLALCYCLFLLNQYFRGFMQNTISESHSYAVENPTVIQLKPQNAHLTSLGKDYQYTANNKHYTFRFPQSWTVEKCTKNCVDTDSYTFRFKESEQAYQSISIVQSASWCEQERERMKQVTRNWRDAHINEFYKNNALTTIIEGIENDRTDTRDLYQRSTMYVQAGETCYVMLSHTKNNPALFTELQRVRDTFSVL